MSGVNTRSTWSRCGTKPSISIDHTSSPGLTGDLVQDERPLVERPAELFEQHRGVEEREVVALQDPDPAERGELLERGRRVRLEERARLAAKVVLLGG